MGRLRVGFIGCGGRNRRAHMRYVSGFGDVEMAAVCDPMDDARDAAGDEFGIQARYPDMDEMLDEERLDAVFVATPPHLNATVAMPCLERGVNMLLEKPPGMTASETAALRDAAERSGATVMVGWDRRFNPVVVKARQMVEERGPVVQLVGEFHKSMNRFGEAPKLPEVVMAKRLMTTSIHAIDLVRAMAGSEVAEVHSVVRRAFSEYEDVHAALVLFESGCVAQLTANYTTDARLERYEIHGRDISAYLEGVSQGVVFCDGQRHELTEAGSGGIEKQARFFLDCIKGGRHVGPPGASLEEAVKTMELAEAILEGSRLTEESKV